MARGGQFLLFVFLSVVFFSVVVRAATVSRIKRQEQWCPPEYRYNSTDVSSKSVVAYCRYYGDRFYECTAWNRLLARNHWILSDGIIPREMWRNQNEHVRIAECKFYDNYQYRCRQTPVCIGVVCERKTCPWGGRYEGTPQAGFKDAVLPYDTPETNTIRYEGVDNSATQRYQDYNNRPVTYAYRQVDYSNGQPVTYRYEHV